jgi:protocatechuate 3,4-dioxygenase beta subunit
MRTALRALTLALGLLACSREGAALEPIVGLPCEGCEAVFEGLPADRAAIPAVSRIAPAGEPGEPLVLSGTVRSGDGQPAAGLIVYAYHTDAGGIYPRSEAAAGPASHRHGRLRGFARTGPDGRYRFDTIRPGGYPNTDIPQHVHLHVIESGRCSYYLDDVVFTDDPRLTARQREAHKHGRGGYGVVTPRKDAAGTWIAERDITLGAGISGYDRCASVATANR